MGQMSGLHSVSGVVVIDARVYTGFRAQPFDAIDPKAVAASMEMLARYGGDFNFGGAAGTRNVDIFGSSGFKLSCIAGFLELDRVVFRVMTTTIPVIINDMFFLSTGA